jgi:Cellulase (glycosyl hydrolase family 5)
MRRSLLPLLLCALAAASLALPAGAAASRSMAVGIADDRALLGDPDHAPELVAKWQALGVDTVRILADWGHVAPAAGSPTKPAGFVGSNPDAPGYDWHALDAAIGAVRAAGMSVILSVTGPGPLWASSEPARGNPRWKPRSTEFAAFATAVARRYGPQVDTYIVWNEPNQPLWLSPQYSCRSFRRCTPASPAIYRALARAAYPAIKAADPGARVLVGSVSPTGGRPVSASTVMKPLVFLRELGCVDGRYRPKRSGACRGFKALVADGIDYHPHGVLRAPNQSDPDPDQAQIADLGRLEHAIDAIQRAKGLRNSRAGRLPLWLTEFGYQTDPPDPYLGVSPSQQALWLQWAAYLAWKDPRVQALVQYEWVDEPVIFRGSGQADYSGWQSGLNYADGRPKPSLAIFADPLWVDVKAGTATVWGQVRPGGAHQVTVQTRPRGSAAWTTVATMTTDSRGYFHLRRRAGRRAQWRYTWTDDGGAAKASAAITS